jgi:hypothetical protein
MEDIQLGIEKVNVRNQDLARIRQTSRGHWTKSLGKKKWERSEDAVRLHAK